MMPPTLPLNSRLSTRQAELVGKIAEGKSNKIIAFEMGLTYASAKIYTHQVFQKLGFHSRYELISWWAWSMYSGNHSAILKPEDASDDAVGHAQGPAPDSASSAAHHPDAGSGRSQQERRK